MKIGQLVSQFEDSVGTVKDFNTIFDVNVLGAKEESELEYLGLIIGKPDHRLVNVDGEDYHVNMKPSFYKTCGNNLYKYTAVGFGKTIVFRSRECLCDYFGVTDSIYVTFANNKTDVIQINGYTLTKSLI
jgi:hypothetical protein